MKKLNVQVYQGSPDVVVTKDNNNLFIEGDVQYSTGSGTIVKSISSVKTASGSELLPTPVEEFPYEYACPDDFSVTIKPEDWVIDGESWAHINIEAIQLPNAYYGCVAKCNNAAYDNYNQCFNISISFVEYDVYVYFIINNNKITSIDVGTYQELDPSDIQSTTLNFTDLIFMGAKKAS